MSQRVICQPGAIDHLGSILKEGAWSRVFLVTGRASYAISGAEQTLSGILAPYQVTRFFDFEVNPRLEDLLRGIERLKTATPQVVIAVGGGTVMDMAKMINIFASQEHPPLDYIEGRQTLQGKGCPLLAIPTTAGSGSQATHFSVVYVEGTKYSVAHPQMLPGVTVVDPQFLTSVPKRVAAATGLDALDQGIESYWAINSTDESKGRARQAIELMLRNLPVVIRAPTPEARFAVAQGAQLAGEAINITKTTAPHAVSYPLTSHFGVAHGHAVGLTLSSMLLYNSEVGEDDVLDPRGVEYVRQTIDELAHLLNTRDPKEAKRAHDELMDEVGLSRDLQSLGIRTKDDLELIIEDGFDPERVTNNPRRLTAEALRKILSDLYDQQKRD